VRWEGGARNGDTARDVAKKHPSASGAAGARATLFAALGDETRLGVLAKLMAEGPQSIARLTAGTLLTRQAVTKHLHVLESAGLLRSRRIGRESHFALQTKPIKEARKYLKQMAKG
jgi:DNA-binding transcriptional ArsR family regulator